MSDELEPFDLGSSPECPKCTSRTWSTTYCSGGQMCFDMVKYRFRIGEHLHRECAHCGYVRYVHTADSDDAN